MRSETLKERGIYRIFKEIIPFQFVILLILYYNKEIKNIYNLSLISGYTYAHIHNKINDLKEKEYIHIEKNGRINTLTLNQNGIDLIKKFMNEIK